MKILTVISQTGEDFDAQVNKAMAEGWRLTDRGLRNTGTNGAMSLYAELVLPDAPPEPVEPDLLTAMRAVQGECNEHTSCRATCPLWGYCGNQAPHMWNLEEANP